jgi:hypothetical protein
MYFFHAIIFKTYSNKNTSEKSAIFSYLGAELFKLSTIGGTPRASPRFPKKKKQCGGRGHKKKTKLKKNVPR